jgi:IS30 family transposase
MLKGFKHLNLEEREVIYGLLIKGYSFRKIAKELGRSHTSLVREYRRNTIGFNQYLPCRAERRAVRIGERQRFKAPLKNSLVFLYVRRKLRIGWSPETISGRLSVDHPRYSISPEAIYQYIYKRKFTQGMKLWTLLKLHRKKRMKKYGRKVQCQKIKNAIRIEERDKNIELRQDIGHWETDNMEGLRSDTVAVSATVERKTRFVILSKLNGKGSKVKTQALINRMNELPERIRMTITTDNGAENALHEVISIQLNTKIYFCNPYHSWEKGTVENTIGRLRYYLPKKTSLNNLTDDQLRWIEYEMNNTPRKCLNYLTPYEKMYEELYLLNIRGGAIRN